MIEAYIYNCLSSDSEISSLVEDRIYPLTAPDGAVAPYITYQNIIDAALTSVQGDNYAQKTRFQIDIFDKKYLKVLEITGAVKNALFGLEDTVYDFSSRDIPIEPDTKLYRRLIDFRINN